MRNTKFGVPGLIVVGLLCLIIGATAMAMAPTASAAGEQFSVSKTPSTYELPGVGGPVTFTIDVNNFSGGPLTQLIDSEFGDLITPTDPRVTNSTCVAGSADTLYTCEFTAMVTPVNNQPHLDFVTATVLGEGPLSQQSNTVYIDFVGITATKSAFPSTLPAAGGDVTFTFGVTNAGSVPVEVTTLDDDVFGDLNGKGTCETGRILFPGFGLSCYITETLPAGTPGTPHVNTFTATASSESRAAAHPAGVAIQLIQEEGELTATASASVDFVTTGIAASKMASPTSVPETGGDVTFTFGVTNTGEIDIIVDSLVDDVLGNLDGQGDCVVGVTVMPAETFSCTVTKMLTGTAGTPHVNTFTANATTVDTEDLEENTANATAAHQSQAMAIVNFTAPAPTVMPTAMPTAAPAVGRSTLEPFIAEPTAVPTPAPTAAPVATADETQPTAQLAFTASESTLPALLALTSVSAGALLLGFLRRREDRR